MANTFESLLQNAAVFVRQRIEGHLSPGYLFHNIDRILERVELAGQFAEALGLSEEDAATLTLAVWFQDSGYLERHEKHREASLNLLDDFHAEVGGEAKWLEPVKELILNADEPEPHGVLPRALHDINASWLGKKRFFGLNNLLRLEKENLENYDGSYSDWQKEIGERLVQTVYLTSFGRSSFLDRKIKNIAKHRRQLARANQKEIRKRTGKDFGRGVDTVYRVTFRNHINLSGIADGKANMIISINTVVLSLLITVVSATFSSFRNNLSEEWYFGIPVLLLMLTSVTALVFAVLSALPKVSSSNFTDEDLKKHKISLLYFGNFLQLKEDKFVGYLRDLKEDQEILYDDLSRDLYKLGAVLDTKYRLLTYAYRTFMVGLVVSVIALLIIVFVHF